MRMYFLEQLNFFMSSELYYQVHIQVPHGTRENQGFAFMNSLPDNIITYIEISSNFRCFVKKLATALSKYFAYSAMAWMSCWYFQTWVEGAC